MASSARSLSVRSLLRGHHDPFEEAKRQIFRADDGTPAERTAPLMSLRDFVAQGWREVEPEIDFIPAYHVDAICEHLEWVSTGEINQLIINIGPGYAKSSIVSVFWPSWMWSWRPGWRSIFGSYDMVLSTRDSTRSRAVLSSEWFRETFEPSWRFTNDQNEKKYYRNNRSGERRAASTTGANTGFRGHCVAVDDPVNAIDRNNLEVHKRVCDWWDKAMSSRQVDPRRVMRVVIGQRMHQYDLSGHLLRKGGYVHLNLPTEFDPRRRSVTVTNSGKRWIDRRTKAGELLFPEFFTRDVVEQAKKDLGTLDYEAQHGQNPQASAGGIFKRDWFKRYTKRDLPPVWEEELQAWDLTFKATTAQQKKKVDVDFVVGNVWSRLRSSCYLRHERRGRMGFTDTKKAIRDVTKAWPAATAKLIENKANGPAIVEELKDEIDGLIAVENSEGVIAWAHAIAPYVEAGNIFILDDSEWPEANDWLDEVCAFPNGVNDDRVTALCLAVMRMKRKGRADDKPKDEKKPPVSAAVAAARQRF